jgi:hypothetical protein
MLLPLLVKGEEKGLSFGGYPFPTINHGGKYLNLSGRKRGIEER